MHKSCTAVDLSFLDGGLESNLKDINMPAWLVDMDGIVHVVLRGIPADEELFKKIKTYIMEELNPPAMGVMFMDDKAENMEPVVYVKDVDTTYFEGSCGSGTTACGIAMAQEKEDGCYSWNLKQPAGEIMATVEVVSGNVKAVYIEGPVEIGELMEIEL